MADDKSNSTASANIVADENKSNFMANVIAVVDDNKNNSMVNVKKWLMKSRPISMSTRWMII